MGFLTSLILHVSVLHAKKRLIDAGKLAQCPNMRALSEGTVKDHCFLHKKSF